MKKKLIIGFNVLMLVLIAVSCKVASNIKADVKVPDQYSRAVQNSEDTTTIADIRWSDFFKDTTLQRLIERGINHNYDLLVALTRISASREKLKQAKVLQFPSLNFSLAAQSFNPSQNSLNGISLGNFLGQKHIEDYNAAFNLNWEADIWGKIKSQKEKVRSQYLQTYEAKNTIQTQIVANIAHGYFNLLMLDEQLDITKSNLQLNDTILSITKLQYNAGIVSILALEQAEAQKQSLNVLIPQLELNIAVQENALSVLTGAMPDVIRRDARLSDVQVPTTLQSGFPAGLLSRRPDIRALELDVRIRNSQVGIAQANMYPALTITASGGINSFQLSNWFQTPASLFGNILGGLTQPVFQRRTLKTNLNVAKIQREESVLEFRRGVLVAVGEVSDALVQNDKLKLQAEIGFKQVATLQRAISNAQQLYNSGLANYLEVLIVQGNALQSELNLSSIRRQQLSAMVDLYRSLGGGWK
ncbi:MAG: efflux transporter outer membrane subunit [Ferruginibacter sp.]